MSPEAGRLLVKAGHALHAAEILLDAGEPDFAAGRCYYAMFYAAEALLVEDGQRFRKHSAVHAAFGERFVRAGRIDAKLHRWLLDAFDKRIVADYDIEYALATEDVQEMIRQAREFIAAASGVLNPA